MMMFINNSINKMTLPTKVLQLIKANSSRLLKPKTEQTKA